MSLTQRQMVADCAFSVALAWLLLQFLMSGYGQGPFVAARVAELSDGFIGSPRERLKVRDQKQTERLSRS
jgi:hypothetical protein